jgi:26S proteasome regulatory subunit N11
LKDQICVGWYHFHPGFGCWLSGTDVGTQKSQEQLNPRAFGVVVDPVQSVKGKVVIDAFRSIDPQTMMTGQEPRQTTAIFEPSSARTIPFTITFLNGAVPFTAVEITMRVILSASKSCRV